MRTTKSRQKSYADVRRRNLEFEEGDMVFLKVAPMKSILRIGCKGKLSPGFISYEGRFKVQNKGKLSPEFIEPFKILERIGSVAYKLALPPSLLSIHDVFHVSMLRKYVTDPTHVIDYKPLEIEEDLSYPKKIVKILAREVMWRNHQTRRK